MVQTATWVLVRLLFLLFDFLVWASFFLITLLNQTLDEILLSNDKTIAIIDGSGVLADPAGIDRGELVRLAKLRVMISHFDRSKLSKDGYVVLVEDQDVRLPSKLLLLRSSSTPVAFVFRRWPVLMKFFPLLCVAGEVVLDGTDFRNTAHFRFKADLFVPCGGR